ncbi:MAG: TolC family protein [Candidatus Cloacimonetes bacterium]|nr:TolC family protein [Candidatus Cloacimonadota bacterium]
MKKLHLTLILLLCSCLMAATISLEESLVLAKENNKDYQSRQYSYRSSVWNERNALSGFFPRVSFNSTLVRIDSGTYEDANAVMEAPVYGLDGEIIGNFPMSSAALGTGIYRTSYNNNIIVQQPLFNGGKVILGYQMARLSLQQAKLDLLNSESDLRYQVAALYFGLLELQDLQKLANKSLSSARSHLEKVQQKYELGLGKQSDLLQWQLKVKNEEASLMEIESSFSEMSNLWKILLGTGEFIEPQPVALAGYDEEILYWNAMREEEKKEQSREFLALVEENSPTLAGLALTRNIMQKKHQLSWGNFLPSLNLQFTYEIENDDRWDLEGNDNWNLAAVISLPLFTAGDNYTRLRQSKYELESTRAVTEYAEEHYLVNAENVFHRILIKARAVTDSRTALELAEENHRVVNQLYEQGMVTNSDLLDAETMLFGSEMNQLSSYYEFIITKYEMDRYIYQGSEK